MARRTKISIGTRGSRLALRQVELAVALLNACEPALEVDILEVKTQGDRDQTTPLTTIGGQGVFVKELEARVLSGDVDIAVHSLKDVPAEIAQGLTLAAFLERGDPRDALVTKDGKTLTELPSGARIGTASRRRAVQLRALRPDIETAEIRGNVDTRIRKVDEGDYDAAVLAQAGLERIGMAGRISQVFEVDELIPAVGQGALVLEARIDDDDLLELLAKIDDANTRLACEAERAFMTRLGGGCRLPFGAYATVSDGSLTIRGFVSDDDGSRRFQGELTVSLGESPNVGTTLADRLLGAGAAGLLPAVEASGMEA